MNDVSRKYWRDFAKTYSQVVGDEGDDSQRNIINPVVNKLLGDLAGKVVLDAGCGNGYRSAQIAKIAKKVVGVDFTKDLIQEAKDDYRLENLEFRVGDLTNLTFEDDSFDLILCNMVLIDVEEPELAIRQLSRVLRPNGRMVVSFTHPCFENPPNTYTLLNDQNQKIGRVIGSYFDTGLVKDTKNNYQHYHYTLSDYINWFASNSLFVEKIVEPNSSEIMHSEDKSHHPYFLIVRLRKVSSL